MSDVPESISYDLLVAYLREMDLFVSSVYGVKTSLTFSDFDEIQSLRDDKLSNSDFLPIHCGSFSVLSPDGRPAFSCSIDLDPRNIGMQLDSDFIKDMVRVSGSAIKDISFPSSNEEVLNKSYDYQRIISFNSFIEEMTSSLFKASSSVHSTRNDLVLEGASHYMRENLDTLFEDAGTNSSFMLMKKVEPRFSPFSALSFTKAHFSEQGESVSLNSYRFRDVVGDVAFSKVAQQSAYANVSPWNLERASSFVRGLKSGLPGFSNKLFKHIQNNGSLQSPIKKDFQFFSAFFAYSRFSPSHEVSFEMSPDLKKDFAKSVVDYVSQKEKPVMSSHLFQDIALKMIDSDPDFGKEICSVFSHQSQKEVSPDVVLTSVKSVLKEDPLKDLGYIQKQFDLFFDKGERDQSFQFLLKKGLGLDWSYSYSDDPDVRQRGSQSIGAFSDALRNMEKQYCEQNHSDFGKYIVKSFLDEVSKNSCGMGISMFNSMPPLDSKQQVFLKFAIERKSKEPVLIFNKKEPSPTISF